MEPTSRSISLVDVFVLLVFLPLMTGSASHAQNAELNEIKVKAEKGNAGAQFNLGWIYATGKGVPIDSAGAAKWYHRAASQGHVWAQYHLGLMYERGVGVIQDHAEAYKWFNLAAARGNQASIAHRDKISKSMSPAAIEEGQRRSALFVVEGDSTERSGSRKDSSTVLSVGSGFFITDDGYLITNFHVVQGGSQITVKTAQGTFPGQLIKADAVNDVALLKVQGRFRSLPLSASGGVKLGDWVFTIGFPNIDLQGVGPKLTRGEINSLAGMRDDPRHLQISAPLQPGNSGGPLLNQYGNVVGIVTFRLDDLKTLDATGFLPQNVNYAIKSSLVTPLLETVPELATKLKLPHPIQVRKFEELVKEAQDAAALVLVF